VINISNFTSKDNPQRPLGGYWETGIPPVSRGPGGTGESRESPRRGYTLLEWLAYRLRRWGDRWFAMSDNEAYWRGWEITKTRGGLGRVYRDPRFGTLATCARCAGAGVRAAAVCGPCQGTGRISLGKVS
jgi:hypothetical protein